MNPITNPLRCIILWIMLVVCMVLHFNYGIGRLIYGIDVVSERADGVVPLGTHMIRTIFYHLPFVWVVVLMTRSERWIKGALFLLAILYNLAHASHLAGELIGGVGASQGPLLVLTLGLSCGLTYEHYRYWRKGGKSS